MASPSLHRSATGTRVQLAAAGSWTIDQADELLRIVDVPAGKGAAAELDLTGVDRLDTFGAWLIERLVRTWREKGASLDLARVPERFSGLLNQISRVNRSPMPAKPKRGVGDAVVQLGESTATFGDGVVDLIATLGTFAASLGRAVLTPSRARLTSVVYHLDRVGWQAVGIILLITFVIGCIIAQQGFFNFRRFGAEDYVVSLIGIITLREMGLLLVAVMIAGRSGSAYTAELGAMKMREEIDALRTMGVDPTEVLVLPRVLALTIAMPALTFLGSMAALIGGGLVSWLYGGMSPLIYIQRLHEAVSTNDFIVGMVKAPVMALVIGIVACAEGMRVKGSTESLGLQTTASVVKSIFLVIILDGFFAMFFAAIGI